MPYTLRKAPKRDLYWVVNKDTGKKYSKEPIPKERAEAQRRALYASEPKEGGAIEKTFLQQMASAAYSDSPPKTIGPFELLFNTPTLKFYRDGDLIVVAVRGTRDASDVAADGLAMIGQLRRSDRYKRDIATLKDIQSKLAKIGTFRYMGAGHSLGGAILDTFLRAGLIQSAVSYNPLPEPQELGGNPRHYRVYHKDDPIYKTVGRFIPNVEVRSNAPIWKQLLRYMLPFGIGEIGTAYDRHRIDTFKGGKIDSEWLEAIKAKAKQEGYDPDAIRLAKSPYKVEITTPDDTVVRFGRRPYKDYVQWLEEEKAGRVPKGTADSKRERFWKSHSKMKGDWRNNDYSPNWLAMRILW